MCERACVDRTWLHTRLQCWGVLSKHWSLTLKHLVPILLGSEASAYDHLKSLITDWTATGRLLLPSPVFSGISWHQLAPKYLSLLKYT